MCVQEDAFLEYGNIEDWDTSMVTRTEMGSVSVGVELWIGTHSRARAHKHTRI
jgi:hypothetical protein